MARVKQTLNKLGSNDRATAGRSKGAAKPKKNNKRKDGKEKKKKRTATTTVKVGEAEKIKTDRINKRLSAMRSKLSHDRYATNLRKRFEGKGSGSKIQEIFKNGLDRDANLSRTGIPRAEKRLMHAVSWLADGFCKKLSRQLLAIMFVREFSGRRISETGVPEDDEEKEHKDSATSPRIMGKHVEEALKNMGCRCLFP